MSCLHCTSLIYPIGDATHCGPHNVCCAPIDALLLFIFLLSEATVATARHGTATWNGKGLTARGALHHTLCDTRTPTTRRGLLAAVYLTAPEVPERYSSYPWVLPLAREPVLRLLGSTRLDSTRLARLVSELQRGPPAGEPLGELTVREAGSPSPAMQPPPTPSSPPPRAVITGQVKYPQ